ncbi:hypothetical protein AOLI_G00052890 [Acnodon oligacanthus]
MDAIPCCLLFLVLFFGTRIGDSEGKPPRCPVLSTPCLVFVREVRPSERPLFCSLFQGAPAPNTLFKDGADQTEREPCFRRTVYCFFSLLRSGEGACAPEEQDGEKSSLDGKSSRVSLGLGVVGESKALITLSGLFFCWPSFLSSKSCNFCSSEIRNELND